MSDICRHTWGWCSVKAHYLFVDDAASAGGARHVGVGFSGRRNKVVMKCNRASCRAHRNAYFDYATGAFTKFGRVRFIAKAEGR